MIEKNDKSMGQEFFDMMYSLFALPNVIVPIIAGMLIDKIGYNTLNIIFSLLILVGNLVIYVGFLYENIFTMIIGRAIFGLGEESLTTGLGIQLIIWFRAKELALSQGIFLSFTRLGSILNCLITPRLVSITSSAPFAFSVVICAVSLIAVVIGAWADHKYLFRVRSPQQEESLSDVEEGPVKMSFREIFGVLGIMKPILLSCLISIILMNGSFSPFNLVASDFLLEKWVTNPFTTLIQKQESVGDLLCIPLIITAAFNPVFGYISDKYGYRLQMLIFSGVSMIISFLLITRHSLILPLCLFGLSIAIFTSVIWPVLALLSPQKIVGTIIGISGALTNLAMVVEPLLFAYLQDTYHSSLPGMNSLMAFAGCGTAFIMIVWHLDNLRKVSVNNIDQAAIIASIDNEYFFKEQQMEYHPLPLQKQESD